MKIIIIGMTLVCAVARIAVAQSQNGLEIHDAWARATFSPTANAAVYLSVTDAGQPDMLVSASTQLAANTQLHESRQENGIMRMIPLATLPVDKDHPITLSPGSDHLMLTGMKQQLKAGDTFPLTLTFAHAGPVEATVTVRTVTATGRDMDMSGVAH